MYVISIVSTSIVPSLLIFLDTVLILTDRRNMIDAVAAFLYLVDLIILCCFFLQHVLSLYVISSVSTVEIVDQVFHTCHETPHLHVIDRCMLVQTP